MASDHRDINRDLHVFDSHPLIGSGLPLWLPAGAAIRDELARLAKELAHADGCQDVYSPVMGKRALYERSGHWSKFAADMFPAMAMGESGDELVLRPANCPHHALIYASSQRSYRELPLRYNENASMFRAERSGSVSGLQRVRQISLDDTHVFARPDQVGAEVEMALRSAIRAQKILGLDISYIRLSQRSDEGPWLGSSEQWHDSERILDDVAQRVASEVGLGVIHAPGEAAFYGPKLDLQLRTERHEETIATVQLDFNQPERFDLTYRGADGQDHRPVMIHRGTVGSMERVTAALLEHYDGRLPLWLSPTQIMILPIAERHDAIAQEVLHDARSRGLRAEISHDGSLGVRIRMAREVRASLIVMIGDTEVESGTVSFRNGQSKSSRAVEPRRLLSAAEQAHRSRQDFESVIQSWVAPEGENVAP